MPDYSKGKIYKLVADETTDIYIGSTAQARLCDRIAGHRQEYKKYTDGKFHYITAWELIKYPSCRIELLEAYSCASKEELNAKEGEWIRRLPCVNKQIAGRGKKESNVAYKEAHREELREKQQVYREARREELKEKAKAYYQANKDTIREAKKTKQESVKDKNKTYYETHKEELRAKALARYHAKKSQPPPA